jgi:formylglycine-generating enzyme required for sulfatase activity
MNLNRIVFSFFILIFSFDCLAQTISISSFKPLVTDLTANTAGTMEMDQNGETAALIKVVTPQTGFTFDGGALGIVKTVQKPSEIWVYVPRGLKKITISHPQLGMLRDYYLNTPIEAARTYEMVLVAGEVQTVVKQARTSQYVVFQLTPPDAVVELNGELLKTEGGVASKMMKFGTYNYRVQAPDYLLEAGSVTVDDPNNKKVVNISLKPNFAKVTINVDNNAEIWVNGEKKGEGSWSGNLGAGTYELEAKKQGHRSTTTTQDFIVTSEPQIVKLQSPTPIYGEADINSSPGMADIYIDGKKVGQTPQMVSDILVGQHQIRISKQGFTDFNSTLTLKEDETAIVSAKLEKTVTEQTVVPSDGSTSTEAMQMITVDNVSFNMIRVDGGSFIMGATSEQGRDDEKPTHQVALSPYYIGETEVTQELWKAIMGSNPSIFKGSNRPVEQVSWNDCQEFIQKLNQRTGRKFRLPTEAEWEFAARGGNKSRQYKYSGSNYIYDVAWFTDNSNGTTHDVKTKQANELGIYDMSGNVWEWCQDWYDALAYYNSNSPTNPTGPTSGFARVDRGGSWFHNAERCRVSCRLNVTPDNCYYFLGLRLAL